MTSKGHPFFREAAELSCCNQKKSLGPHEWTRTKLRMIYPENDRNAFQSAVLSGYRICLTSDQSYSQHLLLLYVINHSASIPQALSSHRLLLRFSWLSYDDTFWRLLQDKVLLLHRAKRCISGSAIGRSRSRTSCVSWASHFLCI